MRTSDPLRSLSTTGELTGVATFHCQQCVEKSLKAMLALHGNEIPRIHDLVTLHTRASEVESLSVEIAELLQLNDAYIDMRYPNDPSAIGRSVPSKAKTQEFLLLAEKVYESCRKRVE